LVIDTGCSANEGPEGSRPPLVSSREHRFHEEVAWKPEEPAEEIADGVLMSRANSNRYLVTGEGRDLLINTGDPAQAARHRERFEEILGRPLDVRAIVFTQSHPDHYSGWSVYGSEATETIAQRSFPEGVLDFQRLAPYYTPRRDRSASWGRPQAVGPLTIPDARITTFVDDSLTLEVGGRRFELIAAPGGETRDSLFVWMPDEKIVFTGNHAGALYLAMPNFTTIRGDRLRSTRAFLLDVERLIDLEAELLVTGHGAPTAAAERVRGDLELLRDAVLYVHDATVRGMNEGRSLPDLMRSVELPPELRLQPGRSPTAWVVRAIWEEYTGWFRFESPTELYGVPVRAIAADLLELCGGGEAIAARAAARVETGDLVEALHLTDLVLDCEPDSELGLRARINALEGLLNQTRGETFDEMSYLKSEIEAARAALGRVPDRP
jgi:alkyl sulfatase BDS1-like metallo-beta-lactamase superfamily hydrolase